MNNLFGYPDAVVYMIQYSDEPIFKIGYTTNLNTRLRRIAVLLPYPVELVHCIYTDSPKWLERYWHDRFASQRRPGSGIRRASEWFDLSDDDVNEFMAHTVFNEPEQQHIKSLEWTERPEELLRESAIRRVIKKYDDLMREHPQQAVKLAKSCTHQILTFDEEVLRMQIVGRSEAQAIDLWEKRAYEAARRKVER